MYELTDTGRATARAWMDELLATRRREFPEFPAALSHLPMITSEEALPALERRAAQVDTDLAELDAVLAANTVDGHSRVAALETEYLRAVAVAERDWLRAVIDDLRSGRLAWQGA
ncbi:hypothetical protein [Microtetraspora malaysiensis]|uniref:hypothetical protein n=1 Tax=Microtetraspora malaysiensis TaxID=161358 RepID=UPI003D8A1EF1